MRLKMGLSKAQSSPSFQTAPAREAIEDAFQTLCNGAQLSMDYFRVIHVKIQGLVAALGPEDFDADVLLGELDGKFGASDNFVDQEELSWYMEELSRSVASASSTP